MEVTKEIHLNSITVRLIKGDLTEAPVDAIVNAANSHLMHGGGVAGAIVRRGGKVIQEESNRIGVVPVGQAAITTGGSLPARFVIHAVGPRWGEGDEEAKLHSAVRSTLRLAGERRFHTIAMPAISAGIFGFPKDRCARIMTEEISAFARTGDTSLTGIDIYLMDPDIIGFFSSEIDRLEKDQ